jgi:hypothetical protein
MLVILLPIILGTYKLYGEAIELLKSRDFSSVLYWFSEQRKKLKKEQKEFDDEVYRLVMNPVPPLGPWVEDPRYIPPRIRKSLVGLQKTFRELHTVEMLLTSEHVHLEWEEDIERFDYTLPAISEKLWESDQEGLSDIVSVFSLLIDAAIDPYGMVPSILRSVDESRWQYKLDQDIEGLLSSSAWRGDLEWQLWDIYAWDNPDSTLPEIKENVDKWAALIAAKRNRILELIILRSNPGFHEMERVGYPSPFLAMMESILYDPEGGLVIPYEPHDPKQRSTIAFGMEADFLHLADLDRAAAFLQSSEVTARAPARSDLAAQLMRGMVELPPLWASQGYLDHLAEQTTERLQIAASGIGR